LTLLTVGGDFVRVLITGFAGFAGGHLATYLSQDKTLTLYGVDRYPPTRLPPDLQESVTCFVGDLQSEAFVREVLREVRPDVIYHLAGQAFVPTAWSGPWETFQNNVLPQFHLFKGVIELDLHPRFLSVTSGKLYGYVPPELMPIKESTPLRPDNPYDLSKVTQDLMAQQYYLSHKLSIVRARPFNHIGPRQSPNFVTAAFARQIAMAEAGLSQPVVKVGNLSAARDFTDARDVARAYAMLIQKGRPGEAYNIGSGRAVEVQHILDVLVGLSSIKVIVEQDPARMRPADQPISYGDISKIKAEVGWQPEIPLEQSLADILAYWRAEVAVEED
jgi:GDP-4-dehydro-6-deoxy-D-mannose reductase